MSRPYFVFAIISLLILTILMQVMNHDRHGQLQTQQALQFKRRAKSAMTAMAVIVTLLSIYATNLILTGIHHGVFEPDTNLTEIASRLPVTPKETPVREENLSNAILIFFKFGCSDCEAIHDDLQVALKNTPNVYYISTRSTQGLELQKRFPIEETPSAVYVYPDGERFAKFVLHTRDEHGKIILNQDFIRQILQIREQETDI